jgi:hypothetical protein
MTDFTVNRPGQINGAGATDAIFLKMFSGETLSTYQETNVMRNYHKIRSISSGKSAQFVYFGKTTAAYHTPGAEMLGNAVGQNERTILIDGLLVANVSVANIDEAMSHYEVRQEYASLLGRALALKFDKQCLQVGVLAARAATTITGNSGGSVLTNAAFDTDGEALAEGIFDAAQALDEKDVPQEDRFFFVLPKHYWLMARSTKVLNRDWGGKGSYSDGRGLMVAGVKVVMTNNLPNSVIAADSPAPANTYHGTFTNTVGLLMHKEAIGTVNLMDLSVEKEYSVRHQATLMVAKIATGHGIVRPECAVEFAKA